MKDLEIEPILLTPEEGMPDARFGSILDPCHISCLLPQLDFGSSK